MTAQLTVFTAVRPLEFSVSHIQITWTTIHSLLQSFFESKAFWFALKNGHPKREV